MKPIRIPHLDPEQLDALEKLYRSTRNARLRTRAQMVLLAAERRLSQRRRSQRSFAPARRRLGAGSSVIWPRESRDCATSRILARRAR